jgi:hypothetical protein
MAKNGCLDDVGILDGNGKLTEKAKNTFIEEVQDIIKYGTKNIPVEVKPSFSAGIEIPPNPNPEAIPDLKNKTIFSAFHKNYIGRYEKIANDLNVSSNFSLLPAIADPIALAGSAFGVELPPLDFPGGFIPYFSGLLPQKLLLDLIDAGKTEFLKPDGLVKLVDKLVQLKAPPIPPIPVLPVITPPAPIPGLVPPPLSSPDLTDAKIPSPGGIPEIQLQLPEISIPPNLEIPLPPQAVLSTLAAKELAAFTNIPKLLLQIIAKIPSLVAKLANIPAIMEEICKLVIGSGVLGDIKPTSSIELAASIVLSRKISEMLLTAAMGSTIGSAPGSATTGVTQKTSGPNEFRRYKSKPKKEATKAPELTPAQKAKQRAIGLAGSSYGDPSERSRYTQGLFIIESVLGKFDPASINIYGEAVGEGEKYTEQQIIDAKKASLLVTNKKLRATPIRSTSGFIDFVESDVAEQSSCGLFVRSCISAAGCNNYFFLSLYAKGAAIDILLNIGLMRNYRWVEDKGGPGIINDLKKDGEEYKALRELIPTIAGPDSYPPAAKKGTDKKTRPDITAFYADWVLQNTTPLNPANGTIKSNTKELQPYLKPFEERACIFGKELVQLAAKGQFPKLQAGDAILICKTVNNSAGLDRAVGGEHILLVTKDRNTTDFIYSADQKDPANLYSLTTPIFAIEGGALDDDNTEPGSVDLVYKDKAKLTQLLNSQGGDIFKMIPENYREGDQGHAKVNEAGKQYYLGEFEKSKSVTFHLQTDIPRPSAILEAKYDLGFIQIGGGGGLDGTNDSGTGLFLGISEIPRTNKLKNKEQIIKEGKAIGINPRERRVLAIFKTNNYCKQIENNGPDATEAIQLMDATPFNDVTNAFQGRELDKLGYFTFREPLLFANFGLVTDKGPDGKPIKGPDGKPLPPKQIGQPQY